VEEVPPIGRIPPVLEAPPVGIGRASRKAGCASDGRCACAGAGRPPGKPVAPPSWSLTITPPLPPVPPPSGAL